MARAYFNCECGKQVEVYGRNRRDADRLADWHESKGSRCAECERAEFARQNVAAGERNAAAGLPPLTGTEKQIAWAETIREQQLKAVDDTLSGRLSPMETLRLWGDLPADDPGIQAVLPALRAQTSAHWWIDRRDRRASALLVELASAIPPTPAQPDPAELELAAQAQAEATVRPPKELTATVAEIRIIGERIEIQFPEKREDFRQLVRFELDYAWSGTAWGRVITARSGPVTDRVAELGNRLLAAGFQIRIQDADLRRRALAAEFSPERKRWISLFTSGQHQGKLFVAWPREADLYSAAKRLPGSRYVKPGVVVSPNAYDAIDDFAEAHGFAITDAARQALDAKRHAHDAALIAAPERPAVDPDTAPGTMPDPTGEIDPELMED